LKISKKEKFAVIRFVSWIANHDMYGQNKGLSDRRVLTDLQIRILMRFFHPAVVLATIGPCETLFEAPIGLYGEGI